MAINYNDERFTQVTNDKNNAINQSNSTYDTLINDSKGYYDNLIQQSKDWADKQADIQNQQTEFAIDKIEQQKAEAHKDYLKEQKGAYQDYMKQSNVYGSNMQAAGQQGLGGSGWSETIQSGFYNTYQNRYSQARESYNEITMNYNNNIKEAQLQNSSAIATIYAEAQAKQLELALQNFTVIKDLSLNKLNTSITLDAEYNDRWREVEAQINTENALAEQIRQYNETLAEQKRQADLDHQYKQQVLALEREQFNWQKAQASASRSSGGSSSSRSSSGSSGSKQTTSNNTLNNNSNNNNNTSSGTVKLSNGKTGYSSYATAYKKAGGSGPLNEQGVLKSGKVKKVSYNGKSYYYVV